MSLDPEDFDCLLLVEFVQEMHVGHRCPTCGGRSPLDGAPDTCRCGQDWG